MQRSNPWREKVTSSMESHERFHKGKRSAEMAFSMLALQWSAIYSSIVLSLFMVRFVHLSKYKKTNFENFFSAKCKHYLLET
jgi:hypothetical protein